jgi:hypothetical protein
MTLSEFDAIGDYRNYIQAALLTVEMAKRGLKL